MSSLPAFDIAALGPPAGFGDWPELAGLRFEPGRVTAPGGGAAVLELGPKGLYGLSHAEGGRLAHLTSAVDPVAEDQALVERFAPDPKRGVVCLGLGLGYHLEELARRLAPETPLWVLESRPELAACALAHRDLSALFGRPGFRLFIGPFTGCPWTGDPPPQVLWRPATARHFAAEYPVAPPRPTARPRRLARRLLLFQSGYFLDRELMNAARELGLETAAWRFERGFRGRDNDFRDLLALIRDFRPDLALTVNHLGFDADGIMDDLFTRLKLPVASWFVDSPAFILEDNRPGPYVAAFSWDRDYLPFLRERGFVRVHHLPLATDETFFHPRSAPGLPARALAFVGDSLTAATDKALMKLGLNPADTRVPGFLAEADRLAEDFLSRPDLWPAPETLAGLAALADLPAEKEKLTDLAALVTWRGSRLTRLEVLRALPGPRLTVAGDRHWGSLLGLETGRLVPALDYYADLAPFYQASQVNLNITSAQMKTGLNQRVFDVPAAGAFLLTDHRDQLADLFEPGREVITYRGPAEARDLALWYADRPEARDRVVRAAMRRIQGGHFYRHRLAALLTAMG